MLAEIEMDPPLHVIVAVHAKVSVLPPSPATLLMAAAQIPFPREVNESGLQSSCLFPRLTSISAETLAETSGLYDGCGRGATSGMTIGGPYVGGACCRARPAIHKQIIMRKRSNLQWTEPI